LGVSAVYTTCDITIREEMTVRKIIVSEFLTLDGVMQAPGDPNEDRSDGFDQGGWQLGYFDDALGSSVMEGLAATGGFLLGRKTYEIFAAHWPKQPADDPLAGTFNELPKYVVSTTLGEPLAWQNSILIRGDVAGELAKLKEQPGKDITVIGSGELVQTLIRHDLVDEYRLMVHPIVFGNGKRLFREGSSPTRLRLADSKTSSTGVLILTYEPAREAVGAGAGATVGAGSAAGTAG
jgi:dihydrofolate reductase